MIEPMALLMGMQTGRLISGQRVKTAAPALWETLFEGEVTTEYGENAGIEGDSYIDFPVAKIATYMLFEKDDGIRVTFNNESKIHTSLYIFRGSMVGNDYLIQALPTDVVDDGGNYTIVAKNLVTKYTNLYTRTPGTYQVKIERALFEPVAYLYNGARAPKLPDIPTDYPYVSMYYHSSLKGMRYLYFSKSPCYMVEGSKNWYVPAPYLKCGLSSDADYNEWKEPTLSDSTEDHKNVLPKWANHDISDPDPNVADNSYTTSDPLPVYE